MAFRLLLVAVLVTWGLPRASSVTYIPYTMEDSCDGAARTIHIPSTGPGSAIIVRSHQGAHYKSGLTCHFIVKTNKDYRILVVFDALQFPGNTDNNCSDAILLSNAEGVNGPICSSSTKDVVSKENVLNLTWTTGGGTAASADDGFEAIITAYKPNSRFCTFSEYKCDNHRCVADNLACDGHNNCGDNSDEKCDFGSTFWRSYGATVMMVGALLLMGMCMVCPLLVRACAPQKDQDVQTYAVRQSGVAFPPPGQSVDPTPYGRRESDQPSPANQYPSMPVYGVSGIPVNLETGRQMRYPQGPPHLSSVDYPRSGVNPVVMSVTDASAPSMADILSESQPLLASRANQEQQQQPPGFTDLQQPFRAANAQVPQRARMPMFQHSHPPLSLYDQPDPMRAFAGFGMGGPMGAPIGGPMGGVMGAPLIAGMGGPMGVPLAGPMGGPFQPMHRFPTFIIIETGDDDSESHELGLFPPARAALPSETSSSNQDTVFPTLLIQQRQQQREQREAEEAERRNSDSGNKRQRPNRRNRRHGGGTDSAGGASLADGPDTAQVAKDEKNEARKPRNFVPTTVTPTGTDAAGALARLRRPADKKAEDKKEKDKDIPEAEKTVMRMEHIETTLSNAAAALRKMGFFGRPISAPSGNDCIGQGTNGVVVRRAKSQWDAPLGTNNEEEKLIYDLPSESTYEYASVWSNSRSSVSETTPTTSETDASKETTQSSETDTDVNYLRPTVSLENITVLDKEQQREKGRHLTRKRQ